MPVVWFVCLVDIGRELFTFERTSMFPVLLVVGKSGLRFVSDDVESALGHAAKVADCMELLVSAFELVLALFEHNLKIAKS